MRGDSITLRALDNGNIKEKFKKAGIDAAVGGSGGGTVKRAGGTQISPNGDRLSGLEAVEKDKKNIESSDAVVVAYGTNNYPEDMVSEIKAMINKIRSINKDAVIFWVNNDTNGTTAYSSESSKKKNQIIEQESNKLNYSVIDIKSVNIPLDDNIHPEISSKGIGKWVQTVVDGVTSGSSSYGEAGGSDTLQGHKLPATKGGTGEESSGQHGTFSNHASKGQEYVDYYINMRWDYVEWNWDGSSVSTPKTDAGYQWFRAKPRLVLVTNPDTKKSIITAALDSGPAPWTGVDPSPNNSPKQGWKNPQAGTPPSYQGRVSGMPKKALQALGAEQKMLDGSGTDLLYAWAPDQNTKPGPTSLSVGDESGAAEQDACTCQIPGSSGPTGSDVDKFLKALAYQESGGDPKQPGSAGGARGKYQYIDSTWKSSAGSYYPPALKYATANVAPESVQDAVTFLEYSKKFKELNNDLFKLAVSHFYPAANSDPGLLDVIPPSNVITPRQYANKLIQSIKKGGQWEKIPLKYREAPDFEKWATKIDVGADGSSGEAFSGSSGFCANEGDGDNGTVNGLAWPVDKKYWNQNKDWFLKPHHTYPASDIPVSSGTKVYSITEGKVLSSGDQGTCGTGVFIQYKNAQFGYCHGTPGSTKVSAGDKVRAGQLIMLSDNTGRSFGPHLHIQVDVDGSARCPQKIFEQMGKGKSVNFDKLPSSGCS